MEAGGYNCAYSKEKGVRYGQLPNFRAMPILASLFYYFYTDNDLKIIVAPHPEEAFQLEGFLMHDHIAGK